MKLLKFLKPGKTENQERELPLPHEPKKVRLGLVVGHDSKEQGALLVGTELTEYTYNSKVAIGAKQYAEQNFALKVDVEVIFRDGKGIAGAYAEAEKLNCDFVIELHFNSFNKKAIGTETLTSADSDSRSFANHIHQRMVSVFGRNHGSQDRGVKVLSKGDRGGKNVYSFRGPSCLVEPFFGDSEPELGLAKISNYSKELVWAVSKYAQQVGIL